MANKHHTRNQPHYSENEDYHSRNQQRFSTNQQNKNWKIDQSDPIYQPNLFEHIHEMNKHDKQDKTQHHIIINSNHKIL